MKPEIAKQGRSWDIPEPVKLFTFITDAFSRLILVDDAKNYLFLCDALPGLQHTELSRMTFC